MKLIVGLGNPGKKYEHTRHNMGFDVVDLFAELAQIDIDKEVFHGILGRGKVFDEDVFVFKPTTFMNLSGTAIIEVLNYFKIDIQDMIVVVDDMALVPGRIRMRINGSSGGHNGLKSIIENIKTENFKRIRIGIGEPTFNNIDFVLSKPFKEEQPLIDKAITLAAEALIESIKNGFEKAMSKYNN